jgi:crotonobetainyl-CoA:carnitine CoA-transferase CaiB-like acyl-CoA transferase
MADTQTKRGPLTGLTVLDCTHVIAGAWCSMILADLGADVIKIEPPSGEVTRLQLGNFRAFDFVNRNKRAIAVDLHKPEGAAVLRTLAAKADIWVENYRPGALDKLGLGYASLSAINPALVYCSISGFGRDGPYARRGGLDLVAQAMSGLMSFIGEDGAPPASTGVPVADLNAGTFAAIGVLAAITNRAGSGKGQHVETSLLEAALAYTVWESGMYLRNGEIAARTGSRHRLAAPYQALKTSDGYVVVGIAGQSLWLRFVAAIGRAELGVDPRFESSLARLQNREPLQAVIEAHFAGNTSAHWSEVLNAVGIPCGPINSIADALADPQIAAREMVVSVEEARFVRTPLSFSDTPVAVTRGPAAIGEHSREVLAEAGYGDSAIDELMASGAIAGAA